MSTSKIEQLHKENTLLEMNSYISQYTNYDNIQNPHNFKSWWNTLATSTDAPYHIRVQIYEAALNYLPGSYKLWFNYLSEARAFIMQYDITDRRYTAINLLHQRALIYMSKMPRIWLDYLEFLVFQCKITQTRRAFDLALQSLPVTQHEKIWKVYIDWVQTLNAPRTVIKVFKRYLKLNPDAKEDFVYYMIGIEEFEQAARYIIDILNDDQFFSKRGKSKFDFWLLLCEIIETHSDAVKDLECEKIIRHGLTKYTDEIGMLWVALSNYYIKLGLFGKARDIFEEALKNVLTARDFTLVFNAYLKFEEKVSIDNYEDEDGLEENEGGFKEDEVMKVDGNAIDQETFNAVLMKAFEDLGIADTKGKDGSGNNNESNSKANDDLIETSKLNFKFLRLTNLLERRPFLLSDALLRQNPNNVKEWLKRLKLCPDFTSRISTYEKAVSTIDPSKVYGNLSELWISYALYYDSFDKLDKVNETFNRAAQVVYPKSEQSISVWCHWAEMHLRYSNAKDAYSIIKAVCTSRQYASYNHSLVLWSFYVDLETNLGSIEKVRSVYSKMLEIKNANTQTIFNYCEFLEKHQFFEETFRVYEQAIDYLTWPSLYDVWIVYLKKFIQRHKGGKTERVRDLFDQVLRSCPKERRKVFYYMASNYEEKHGLLNHSIGILDEATTEVMRDDRPEVFSVLISKTAKYFGIAKTRNFFNKALDVLEGDQVIEIGLKYASIEMKLGEIDRARGIFTHLSQFCNPMKEEYKEAFWKIWENFEMTHGNVETFQEMESVKRSVHNKYSLNVSMFISNPV